MITRREFLSAAAATALLVGGGARMGRLAAAQAIRQEDLLAFPSKGQLTLLHMADCHAQLNPIYFREPSLNLGVGAAKGLVPHITGQDLLDTFFVARGSAQAYALSSVDFEALARTYGRVGGMDRMATAIKTIRQERGEERVLLLDGGDTLQGSYTALSSAGEDMVAVMRALGVEATTGHWEFTLGADRVKQAFGTLAEPGASGIPFLAGNVRDTAMDEGVFQGMRLFEKGGVSIAVIGQAFPYTPIANPAWMIPQWSFGIRERDVRARVAEARAAGAHLVVLLSHNGFDVDRKLAQRVEGIDIILTAHTHDALPQPVRVGRTLLIASGSHGKFLSRLDLDVGKSGVKGFEYRLIPILADAIAPDPEMSALIRTIRAPHEAMLATELAQSDALLYRRDTFGGTLDDLICDALLAVREAEIALSPGFRWGATLMPGQPITWEDVYNATAISYPAAYRVTMTGERLKATLEDVADNLFNTDPYAQQGGDMVRTGGIAYTMNVDGAMGSRVSNLRLLRTGEPLQADKEYTVAGWASVTQGTEGPPVWDVVATHLRQQQVVTPEPRQQVKIVRSKAG